ncbi:sugar ABC transporter permease [Chloroflexi bacterium TSY]|nr:sugar ABC transporter permease [Chloroflexi bacterium TSY]
MAGALLTSPQKRRWSINKKALRADIEGLLFAAPFIVGLVVLFLGPMIASIFLSFTSYHVVRGASWLGLKNYTEMVQDPLVLHSLRITALWALGSVPLNLLLGLGVAMLLNTKVKGLALWRTLYYVPSVISGVAIALLWVWMFEPRYGIINYLLRILFDIEGPNWLAEPRSALPSFILMSLWSVGGSMLINLAGLQSVPTDLYEAAEVDGAGAWRKFISVTIPMISPVILFNLIMGIIAATQSFTYFYIMTKGGPNNATLTFMLYLYRQAFDYGRLGYGSALAWLLFLVLGGVTLLVFRWSNSWVHYESGR